MNRRQVATAGVFAAAGAAGLGASWWQSHSNPRPTGAEIWPMRFQQPDGGELRLAEFRGHPMLLNFWATWCPPCVSELPLLDRFHRDQPAHGWRVVGLAVDNRASVVEFLKQRPMGFPIGLAGLEGVGLSRTVGNTTGALPFTVLFDRGGGMIDRKLGAIHAEDLQSWMKRTG